MLHPEYWQNESCQCLNCPSGQFVLLSQLESWNWVAAAQQRGRGGKGNTEQMVSTYLPSNPKMALAVLYVTRFEKRTMFL